MPNLDRSVIFQGCPVTRAGAWVDVPMVPDCFIVSLGDLMARWANDVWVSTLHRVTNPPPEVAHQSRRQSLVFFHNPNRDAVIECLSSCQGPGHPPKYPAITSGEHLRRQFVRTQVSSDADALGAPAAAAGP